MADITASMVNSLRKRTGCGLMDCKKALKETDGDEEAAIALLRQKGMAKAAKRAGRGGSEGCVAMALGDGAGALVEVTCETDFVARNEAFAAFTQAAAEAVLADASLTDAEKLKDAAHPDGGTFGAKLEHLTNELREDMGLGRVVRLQQDGGFVDGYVHNTGKLGAIVALSWDGDKPGELPDGLGKDLGMHITAQAPLSLRREDVPADEVEKEKAVQMGAEDLQKKPEQIREKIVEGRMSKWYQEAVLLEQPFVKDPSHSIATHVSQVGGGKATLTAFARLAIGG